MICVYTLETLASCIDYQEHWAFFPLVWWFAVYHGVWELEQKFTFFLSPSELNDMCGKYMLGVAGFLIFC